MTNQKCYPELGSDTSSVWNFRARSSDVISRGNQGCRRQMSDFFVINLISTKDHKLLNVINTSRWNKASLQESDNSLL